MNTIAVIRKIEELSQVPEDQLQWLVDQSEQFSLKQGEKLFRAGDPVDRMLVILSGSFSIQIQQAGQFRLVSKVEAPVVTGLLPYSRAKEAVAYAVANTDSEILALGRDKFHDMIMGKEDLTTALVHIMSSRIRDFTRQEQINDKMASLGKLSAGLAHELNNPSSAVVRSAQILNKHLRLLPARFKDVIKIRASDEDIDMINNLVFSKANKGKKVLTMLEKSSLEDDLLDWMEDHNIEDAEEIAENLVDFGFGEEELDEISGILREEDLSPVIHWVGQVLTTEKLVTEIEDAAKRIHNLVSSIKSYTHMDQAPVKTREDIHKGIENTLTMLNHKIRKGNISVEKQYDQELPAAKFLISEMNQVWTNLIDNAIDAMEDSEKKVLTIKTSHNGPFINVDITDTGSGIPDEIKNKIFDPFFTTKAVGKGTGIGLEVVHQIVTRQHYGSVEVESKPGNTTFKICFPIEQ